MVPRANAPTYVMVAKDADERWLGRSGLGTIVRPCALPALGMSETPPHFGADAVLGGAVSKDGASAVVEFAAGDQRLWVTLPMAELTRLEKLCFELRSLGVDAKNGVAARWHLGSAPKE